MFCAGIWMTASGFRYLDIGARQDWMKQLVRHFRWMGPLLVLISIVLLFAPR